MNGKIIHVQKWPHSHQPTEQELRQKLISQGLQPHKWSNKPGDVYDAHTHDFDKVIYVVDGSITFGFPVEGEPTTMQAGDRLDLPMGIAHNAVVGSAGVTCLEAHRPV